MKCFNPDLDPGMAGNVDENSFSLEVTPELIIDTQGQLRLVMAIQEYIVYDDQEFIAFLDRYGTEGEPEAILCLNAPLAELIDLERMDHCDAVTKKYDVKIKPKYDKIREELLTLVASIDKMEYLPEGSEIRHSININDPKETS